MNKNRHCSTPNGQDCYEPPTGTQINVKEGIQNDVATQITTGKLVEISTQTGSYLNSLKYIYTMKILQCVKCIYPHVPKINPEVSSLT